MKTEEEIRAMLLDVKRDIDGDPSSSSLDNWAGHEAALKWVLGD